MHIEKRWGKYDFDHPEFHTVRYHSYNGRGTLPPAQLQAAHLFATNVFDRTIDRVADGGLTVQGQVAAPLLVIARGLCNWGLAHPIPLVDNEDAFTRWMNTAVLAKEAKDTGQYQNPEQAVWGELAAWYLKVWNLQMVVAEG